MTALRQKGEAPPRKITQTTYWRALISALEWETAIG